MRNNKYFDLVQGFVTRAMKSKTDINPTISFTKSETNNGSGTFTIDYTERYSGEVKSASLYFNYGKTQRFVDDCQFNTMYEDIRDSIEY